MGEYKNPLPVKLVIGVLFQDEKQLQIVRKELVEIYGQEEEVSDKISFTWTNYYKDEVGSNPLRCFISYKELILRERMVEIKRMTNTLENKISLNEVRNVNIDPGYMTLSQFFLMTTKDQRHRAYVGNQIFVEVTLYYKNGKFHSFPWTYRDYQSEYYILYLSKVRSLFSKQLKENNPISLE